MGVLLSFLEPCLQDPDIRFSHCFSLTLNDVVCMYSVDSSGDKGTACHPVLAFMFTSLEAIS